MSYGVRRPKDNWNWVLEEEEALKHLKVRPPRIASGVYEDSPHEVHGFELEC